MHDLSKCDCSICVDRRRNWLAVRFAVWLMEQPEAVYPLATKWPCDTCYRMTDEAGHVDHYWIRSYSVTDGTIAVMTGQDSLVPGIAVFGIDPTRLKLCDCGRWHPPTDAQVEMTRRRVAYARAMGVGGHGCLDPRCALHRPTVEA